jgi:protein involved in polysaccharide export with SLBB domain
MKKNTIKYLLLLSILPAAISAQDFDESFLSSLPEDVRADLINQKAKKDSLEEVQYRRPSTFIKKQDPASDVFGAEIFSMMQSTLMPINEPNFDGSYLLDFGDELQIQFIGQKSSIFKTAIERDGSINIPEIGKIFVSGLSLDKAVNYIKNLVSNTYIGVEAFISLTNVRDIQVLVAGNVLNPGPYVLNGNSNVFHALSVAGGPSEGGSYRAINLSRENKVIETFDLYNIFIFGKSSFGNRLRSGDIVFVEPSQNIVTVGGAVKRPGNYELTNEESLYQAISFSNGLTKYADSSGIKFSRLEDNSVIFSDIEDINTLKGIQSEDADKIYIKSILVRNVAINGAVQFPGIYPMKEGDGIKEIIKISGGYTENAYPFGGILINEATRIINENARDQLNQKFLSNILAVVATNPENSSDLKSYITLLDNIKSSPVSGRVSAEFNLDLLEQNSDLDILLQEGDTVTIPEFLNQVYVFGEVHSSGTTPYLDGKDYKYFVESKGGFNAFSDKENIFVLHPNGETERIKFSKNLFMSEKRNDDVSIYPGSIIFVPRKIDDEFIRRQTIQAYTSMLGNLGVSLASISVLKD